MTLELDKIYCMDCFEGLKDVFSKSVDLIVTDPPYFIENLKEDISLKCMRKKNKNIKRGIFGSTNMVFHADWDSFKDLDEYKWFMLRLLKEFKRILKPKGQVYMFMSWHHLHWLRTMLEEKGFHFYKYLVWYKSDVMGLFPNQYGNNHEHIMWFRNNERYGEVKLNIGCKQRDVFTDNSTNNAYRFECGLHPTPKPINLIRTLVKNGSDEGDLILDCFMGSGTTAVACKQTNRHFIGFDNNAGYCETANKRLAQATLNVFGSYN
jgi:DNA modification methylase